MGFFSNIFGSKKEESQKKDKSQKSPFSPADPDIPTDEMFTIRFKNNGGKFLYCENEEELNENLLSILVENDWFECNVLCNENHLYSFLDENKLTYDVSPDKEKRFAFVSCEALIAEEGSILFSSNQLKDKKPEDLTDNVIVYAKTSQLVSNKSNALTAIRKRYTKSYPTNITTISFFKAKSEGDMMNLGCAVKNLYLLLLEDL